MLHFSVSNIRKLFSSAKLKSATETQIYQPTSNFKKITVRVFFFSFTYLVRMLYNFLVDAYMYDVLQKLLWKSIMYS